MISRNQALLNLVALIYVLTASGLSFAAPGQKQSQPPAKFTERVQKQVMHEILMLPNYDVFDAIGFKVEGYDVTLFGYVANASLKPDAERVIQRIEGVEHVNNRIEVLPVSINDDRLRRSLYAAIYRYGPLQRYALPPIKPIRIIVNRGHVTLEGVVDSNGDKNLVNIRANGVPGVFSVTNHLAVPAKEKRR